MIKTITRILGLRSGPQQWDYGVIGRITRHDDRKTIIETGQVTESGGWEKTPGAGHIVIDVADRTELISVLESHNETPRIQVGDTVGGALCAVVMAVHAHGVIPGEGTARGVALAYSGHKHEYWVWTVNLDGSLNNGVHTSDLQRALNAYGARMLGRLYSYFNLAAPALTYATVAERDRLKD